MKNKVDLHCFAVGFSHDDFILIFSSLFILAFMFVVVVFSVVFFYPKLFFFSFILSFL